MIAAFATVAPEVKFTFETFGGPWATEEHGYAVRYPAGEPDVVVDRPSGTRSFVYGAKVLATAAVVLLLTTATDRDFWAAFWLLASAGLLGVAFAFIERSTVGGAERISQRRVNVDVLLTVALAAVVNVVAVVASR